MLIRLTVTLLQPPRGWDFEHILLCPADAGVSDRGGAPAGEGKSRTCLED